MQFDAIVIGSGISGLNFALRAAEKGNRVLVVTKKKIAETSTNFAQGGIAAVTSQLDNFKKHINDTMVAGCFHNDKKAVEYVVTHGPAAIKRLIGLGVPLATDKGKLSLTREGGHSERRIAFVSDFTGRAIEEMLVKNARKNPNITILEHTFAAELLVKNKTCYGVQILHGNKSINVLAKIVVLATGGLGQIYENTTNPQISTGDGIAMAIRAGCAFRDLEFMQFHPTALKLKSKPRFLISESVRGEGAYLLNKNGERFMLKIHPLAELAPRDIVARAIFEQEKAGPVFIDLRHKDANFIKNRFVQIYKKLKEYGLDLTKDLIPVSPAAHYMCGGIKVNLRGETNIKNMYAFGEVAGTGLHGANRLASNSLLEALVFSDRILASAKVKTPKQNQPKSPIFTSVKLTKVSAAERKKINQITKTLKETMWRDVGIIRTKKTLTNALLIIKKLLTELSKIKKMCPETIEAKNMLQASELVTKSSLARKKSLGCHFMAN
ncbi:MAG: L-aspartate oxidase [Candidatus Gracilibacteria bacterium]